MFPGLMLAVLNRLRRFVMPVDCPVCFHKFQPYSEREFMHWREFMGRYDCPKCGYQFDFDETTKTRAANPAGTFSKPGRSKIQRREISWDEVEFLLPAGKIGAG